MSDFKEKMQQIHFRMGLCSRDPLGSENTALPSPKTPYTDLRGPIFNGKDRGWKEMKGNGMGEDGTAPF